MGRRSWLFAAAAAALLAAPARADNMEEFGFGARAQGMGGAFTALASDGTATYYNPAGLIYSRHLNLTTGFSFADYYLKFDSQRGGGQDSDAERIPDLSAFTIGVSKTIPFDVPDRFAFGIGLFLPTRGIVNVEARAPSSQPEWFRYGKRHDRIHVLPALAVKVTDWLKLGLGASIFVDADGGTTISAGLTTPVQPDFKLKLKPDAGLVAGVHLQPTPWLSFGLTYRSELSFKLDFPAAAVVQGISIPLRLETITFFTPHQLQVGAAVDVGESVVIAFDVLYSAWADYDDVFLVVSSDVAAVPLRVKVNSRDVFSPRLGVELAATDWLALRGGYAWRSAQFSDQDGLTNLVDGDKHTFSMGAGFSWGKAAERVTDQARAAAGGPAETSEQMLIDASYDLDLFLQVHWHPEVSQSKPSPTDSVGDWDAGGVIVNFGFTFTTRF